MTQNIYSLPELIDLALRINEDGIVNFNILHTILQSIVIELKLTDVRPPCNIESNLISKVALQKLKKVQATLKEIEVSTKRVPGTSTRENKAEHSVKGPTEDVAAIEKDETEFSSLPSETIRKEKSPEEEVHPTPKEKDSAIQTIEAESRDIEVTQTPVKDISKLKDDDTETEKMEFEKKSIESLLHPPTAARESEITKKVESKGSDVTQTSDKEISKSKDADSETEKMELEKKSIESVSHPPKTVTKSETSKKVKSKGFEDAKTSFEEISESKEADSETEKMELEKKSIQPVIHLPETVTESETTKGIESKGSEVTPTSDKGISESKDASSGIKKMEVEDLVTLSSKKSSIPTEKISIESVAHPTETAEYVGEIADILTDTKEMLESQEDIVFGKIESEDFLADTSEKSPIPSKKTMDRSISQTSVTTAEPERRAQKTMPERGTVGAQSQWKFTDMNKRVTATEEGLYRLSDIIDRLAEHVAKMTQRKTEGGPSSEELEALDDRISVLEDLMDQYAADHKLLMEMNEKFLALLKEFEALKALAELLEQMRIDISKKADKEETWAALELKADVALVNSKIDRWEFETVIEELGEAVGLLGHKFKRKNDEWEDRAAEIWKAIDSKMTFDVFEAARIKSESRLIALMYGLRKLKKVVEHLLYPEASGVTRCILCRRPACISGLECMEGIKIGDSPKRPLSEISSEDNEDAQKLRKTLDDAIAKRQKLEVPPYSESPDTIIRIPNRRASYRSFRDDEKFTDKAQMKLQPVDTDRKSAASKKNSQIPKLPVIDNNKSKPSIKISSLTRRKITPHTQKSDLYFTKKMLSRVERKRSPPEAVLEVESPKRPTSSKSSVDLIPHPEKTVEIFAPARAMPDVLRREVLLSPKSPTEAKYNISLSPL